MAVQEHGAEVCGCLSPNCFIELFAIQDRQDSVWWWWGNYSSFDYNEDNLHPVHNLQSNMQSSSSSGTSLININAQYRIQNATTHTSLDSKTSAILCSRGDGQ